MRRWKSLVSKAKSKSSPTVPPSNSASVSSPKPQEFSVSGVNGDTPTSGLANGHDYVVNGGLTRRPSLQHSSASTTSTSQASPQSAATTIPVLAPSNSNNYTSTLPISQPPPSNSEPYNVGATHPPARIRRSGSRNRGADDGIVIDIRSPESFSPLPNSSSSSTIGSTSRRYESNPFGTTEGNGDGVSIGENSSGNGSVKSTRRIVTQQWVLNQMQTSPPDEGRELTNGSQVVDVSGLQRKSSRKGTSLNGNGSQGLQRADTKRDVGASGRGSRWDGTNRDVDIRDRRPLPTPPTSNGGEVQQNQNMWEMPNSTAIEPTNIVDSRMPQDPIPHTPLPHIQPTFNPSSPLSTTPPSQSSTSVSSSSGPANPFQLMHTSPPMPTHPLRDPPPLGTLPRRQRSSRYIPSPIPSTPIERTPSLWDVPPTSRPGLMVKKLRMCSHIFDFNDSSKDLEGKGIKTETLKECVDFLGVPDRERGGLAETGVVMREEVYECIVSMFAINLFRPLPPSIHSQNEPIDPEEDEPVLELAWTHLSLVFELFLRFLERDDFSVSVARRFIDQTFVTNLLELFDSEDPRERDFVKTNLHRIYLKFVNLRTFIRRSINSVFHRFVGESDRHNGIAELLEILGSIINGFATPLKLEHKICLTRVLLPLHKSPSLPVFYPQLSYCLMQFLEKDSSLHKVVFDSLLRFWPRSSSTKEVLFLRQCEDILCEMDEESFFEIREPVFKQIGRSLQSQHFQVAEQTLYLFHNENILKHVADNIEIVLPIIFPSLFVASRTHWNPQIHVFANNVLNVFSEINSSLVEKCARDFRDEFIAKGKEEQRRAELWKHLDQIARQNSMISIVPSKPSSTFIPSHPTSTSLSTTTGTETSNTLSSSITWWDDHHEESENTDTLIRSFVPESSNKENAAIMVELPKQEWTEKPVRRIRPMPQPPVAPSQSMAGPVHVRKKSILPTPPDVLKELRDHKSLEIKG